MTDEIALELLKELFRLKGYRFEAHEERMEHSLILEERMIRPDGSVAVIARRVSPLIRWDTPADEASHD